MNIAVTSKEQLLSKAKQIVHTEGISKLNIRRLAAECQVSVGAIYNYFPTKADLMIGVIEEFWKSAFHGVDWKGLKEERFVRFIQLLYEQLHYYLNTFQENWLNQITMWRLEEKEKGKQIEATYFLHMKEQLLRVLQQDKEIPEQVWNSVFTREKLVDFVFEYMLTLLRTGKENCDFLIVILERLL